MKMQGLYKKLQVFHFIIIEKTWEVTRAQIKTLYYNRGIEPLIKKRKMKSKQVNKQNKFIHW